MEDITWLEIKEKYFAFPMVCFCDIPLGRIKEHVSFYGSYGLGLSREWATRNRLNPVFYLSRSSPLGQSFLAAIRGSLSDDKEKKQDEKTSPHLQLLLAHMKPLLGSMVIRGKTIEKNFYLESEWRFVPQIEQCPIGILKRQYDDKSLRIAYNNILQSQSPLSFAPEDVRYIFVQKDTDIPLLVDFMNSQLSHLSLTAMKILLTRITSLAQIEQDI